MDKQLKGMMPKPEKTTFKDYDPLEGTAPPAEHSRDNIASGNLRQHNGCRYTGSESKSK